MPQINLPTFSRSPNRYEAGGPDGKTGIEAFSAIVVPDVGFYTRPIRARISTMIRIRPSPPLGQ